MYDAFSEDYDRFVNWPARLNFELPFLGKLLAETDAQRILDAACGTGMHAVELAKHGWRSAGADLSAAMVAQARANAATAGLEIPFTVAGFGQMAGAFQADPIFPFDAVLCLGNSLPHVLGRSELGAALADFNACLRPGGLLILQNRNFDALAASRERWMEPQAFQAEEREWLFIRFYDYRPDGLIDFNIIDLQRHSLGNWRQKIISTRLRPLLQNELLAELELNGFNDAVCYGSLAGEPFDAQKSGNLVVAARKAAIS